MSFVLLKRPSHIFQNGGSRLKYFLFLFFKYKNYTLNYSNVKKLQKHKFVYFLGESVESRPSIISVLRHRFMCTYYILWVTENGNVSNRLQAQTESLWLIMEPQKYIAKTAREEIIIINL